MNELIKIELKKMSLKGQIKILGIINLLVFSLLLIIFLFDGDYVPEKHVLLDIAIKGIMMVWQSVLISSMIIDEFKTKTMMQLYTYPIKRSAMIGAKLVLIMVMMVAFSLVTQLVQHGLFSGIALVVPSFAYSLNLHHALGILLTSPFAVMLGMVPLTVGLWMKSTIAPIITSFLMIFMLGGSVVDGGMELMNNVLAMLIMGVISLIFVVVSIKDVTKKDLII